MPHDPAVLVRKAYEAYATGDLVGMLRFVAPDLEWTYLEPAVEDPGPQVCYGRDELQVAIIKQGTRPARQAEIEELVSNGDRVLLTLHVPGLDRRRARTSNDRRYDVVTVREKLIVALRACRNREEAAVLAGIA